MDFEFSEDQILLRDSVRQLLAHEHTFELQQAILASPHGHSEKLWLFQSGPSKGLLVMTFLQ